MMAASNPEAHRLAVTAARCLAEVVPLRSDLDGLNLALRRPSPFSALDYLEAVAAHDEHPVPGSEPLLLLAREGGRLVGWLPVRRHRGAAAGLRGGRIESLLVHETDRPGVMARPEDEARCAAVFLRWLDEHESWDELHLVQQAPDSPLHPAPGFRLPRRRLRLWPSNPNCTIHLEGHTLASWFASLPKSHKHNVARLGRRLLSAGQVDMIWSDDRVVLPALLDLYLEVERHSWKAGAAVGIGRSPERVALFRQQLEAGRSARAVVHLLRLDGTPIAGHVGIWFAGELHAREIAFDERLSALGPGLMMMLLLVRGALEEGARRINLLSRFGYYKKEWGAEIQPTETVQFFRVGSVAWARSWFGDLKRRLEPRGEEGRAERVNAARRATVKAPPAEVLPKQASPQTQTSTLAADLESRAQRITSAQLRTVLPFDPGRPSKRLCVVEAAEG
jgi:CelD/BcsL family acetyltransferase involved in cellulose biosynthesis